MTDFRIKTLRCEWLVVIQQVDQYGVPFQGQRSILSIWATADEAYADLPNHGVESEYVKGRWIPKSAMHGYEYVQVQYREVEIV
jgi:hypothetical protein